MSHVLTTVCLRKDWKAYMACNFNCHIQTEGVVKVTVTSVGNISQVMQDTDVVTAGH